MATPGQRRDVTGCSMPAYSLMMEEVTDKEAEAEMTEEAETGEIEIEEQVDDEEKAAQDYDFTIKPAAACQFIR